MRLFITNVIERWKDWRARRAARRAGEGHNVLLQFKGKGQP